MNNINFEQDKTDILDKSENIKSLSNEVQKMESLVKEIEDIEENLKEKKKRFRRYISRGNSYYDV